MITVPEATKQIIERSRYLVEAMSKDLINYSSLARYIKPELEKMLLKKISNASIIMAIKRIAEEIKPNYVPLTIFKNTPEMIVRSNLVEFQLKNVQSAREKYADLIKAYANEEKYFFTMTEGMFESAVIVSRELEEQVKTILTPEHIIDIFSNLSAITIRLPKENVTTPGVYYFFLKSLAWEGVNIMEVISTPNEITIVLQDTDVNSAFSILKGLFPIQNLV